MPVFKSSKVSIWHDVCWSLGRRLKKPAMVTFFKPLYDELQLLDKEIWLESSERGQFFCKSALLAGTSDLPVRCLVCNSMQFNGEYGCWKCLHAGRTEKIGTREHTNFFHTKVMTQKALYKTKLTP